MNTAFEAFCKHKRGSGYRGIEFLLSFEEWCELWQQSGKWHHRGRKKGQYVMARPGDVGPYSIDNIQIVTNRKNSQERKLSEEGRKRLRDAATGNKHNCGRIHTEETRSKMSVSAKKCKNHPARFQYLNSPSPETREKMRLAKLGNKNALGHKGNGRGKSL